MPIIYCAIDMFALNQCIRIADGENNTISSIYINTADVAEAISNICKDNNITQVRLYGNANYLNEIVTDIKTNYNLHYHCGEPLQIEVN